MSAGQERETVTVRGTGGLEIVMDVPDEGTIARERYDAALAAGDLVIVEPPKSRATKATAQ